MDATPSRKLPHLLRILWASRDYPTTKEERGSPLQGRARGMNADKPYVIGNFPANYATYSGKDLSEVSRNAIFDDRNLHTARHNERSPVYIHAAHRRRASARKTRIHPHATRLIWPDWQSDSLSGSFALARRPRKPRRRLTFLSYVYVGTYVCMYANDLSINILHYATAFGSVRLDCTFRGLTYAYLSYAETVRKRVRLWIEYLIFTHASVHICERDFSDVVLRSERAPRLKSASEDVCRERAPTANLAVATPTVFEHAAPRITVLNNINVNHELHDARHQLEKRALWCHGYIISKRVILGR